jgi:2-deoxy-D-gluconate 3-dehydrogenase
MSALFDLTGKTAVVTGCNRGLGQAMAFGLAEAGASIVGVHRSDVAQTRRGVEQRGRRFTALEADLSTPGAAASVLEQLRERSIDAGILVNNAGIIRRADAAEFPEEYWDDVIQVNLKALFTLAQGFGRALLAAGRHGKIINIASMLSFQGGIRVASYTASKHGVLGLTRLLANEWAGRGINVNAIAPGYMETDNTAALRQDKKRNEEILSRIPAGRWGMPEDLQGAVVFLASAASDYVHGHTLAVDGGWLAR